MSSAFSLSSDIPREKLHGLSRKQVQKDRQQQQNLVKQDYSASGLQWANASQQVTSTQKAGSQNVQNKTKGPQLVTPDIEDVAMLSSTVSTKENEVLAPSITRRIISRCGINQTALKEKFRDNYKQSRSHNLLLERFMAYAKMGGLNALLCLSGMSPSEIENIKSEVKHEALAEIDSKISQDWANAKGMMEMMG